MSAQQIASIAAALVGAGTLYINPATAIAAAAQNGTSNAPYSTLAAAVAVANASAVQAWRFVLSPSFAYAGEAPVTVPGGKIYLFESMLRSTTFPGFTWQPSGDFPSNPATASVLFLRNLQVVGPCTISDPGVPATDARAGTENCGFSGAGSITKTGTGGLTWNFAGVSNAELQATFSDSVASAIDAPVNLGNTDLFVSNTQFASNCTSLTCRRLFAKGCSFEQNINLSGTVAELQASVWKVAGRTVTFTGAPGTVLVDSLTYATHLTQNVAIANGGPSTIEAILSGVKQTLGYTGAAPVTHTVLPANHPPGLYQINRCLMRDAAGLTGTVVATHNWHDSGGAQSASSAAASIVGTGIVVLAANNNVVFSDGTQAITVDWAPALVTGSPSMRLYSSAVRVA